MSNSWLRLWHEIPNPPPSLPLPLLSGQPISLVQSIYVHLLVDASRNVTRGHVTVTAEDLASALDVTEEQLESVLSAMQGRVIDGEMLSGWDKRQPKREDAGNPESGAKSAAQRKREQREREKAEQEKIGCHDESRNVTLDKDTDTEEEKEQKALVPSADDTSAYSAEFESFWAEYPKREGGNSKKGAYKAWNARLRSGVKAEDLILSAKRYADQMQAKGNVGTSFVKQAATFLGPDEHWREALASNVHPLRTTASGGVVKGDSRTCPPLTRKGDFEYWNAIENRWEVRNSETHDPATGYAWSYLKSRGMA